MRRLATAVCAVLFLGACSSSVDAASTETSPAPTTSATTATAEPTAEETSGEPPLKDIETTRFAIPSGNATITLPDTWRQLPDETELVFTSPEGNAAIAITEISPWEHLPRASEIEALLRRSIDQPGTKYVGQTEIGAFDALQYEVHGDDFIAVVFYVNLGGYAYEVAGTAYDSVDPDRLIGMIDTIEGN